MIPGRVGHALIMNATTTDLSPLVEHRGSFITMIIPTPSGHDNAEHRFEIERKNALKGVSSAWSDEELSLLDQRLATVSHGRGDALFVVHPRGGATFYEFIQNGVESTRTDEGELPRLAPLIEARQRVVAHVVVEVDLSGADIVAFDGGTVLSSEEVEGDTEHIHRGHPGGWSQRRFQQRAENTWENNADEAADAAVALARRVDARLIAVVGPTRAQSMVADSLAERIDIPIEQVEAGDADGVAAEITRLTADVAASDTMLLIEAVREGVGTGRSATSAALVREALDQGRVDTLLVHDDEGDEVPTDEPRFIDWAIRQALATDAAVHVVPNVALLDEGVAATLRW